MFSPILHPLEFRAPILLQGPRNTRAQFVDANAESEFFTSFDFECPKWGVLDSEVLLTIPINISGTTFNQLSDRFDGNEALAGTQSGSDFVHGGAGVLPNTLLDPIIGFRHGQCLSSAMRTVTMTINDEIFVQHPHHYANLATRFYATDDELRNFCSMSGGTLDTGVRNGLDPTMRGTTDIIAAGVGGTTGVATALDFTVGDGLMPKGDIGAVVDPPILDNDTNPVHLFSNTPDNKHYRNKGLRERYGRLAQEVRAQGAAPDVAATTVALRAAFVANTGVTRHSDDATIQITQRLPFGPFQTWRVRDKVSSIANLRRVVIKIEWVPNWRSIILQDASGEIRDGQISVERGTPRLQLRFHEPPATMAIPKSLVMPMRWYISHEQHPPADLNLDLPDDQWNFQNVLGAGGVPAPRAWRMAPIIIRNWPDKLFICVRSTFDADFDSAQQLEMHLEIVQLDVTVDGMDGKLASLSREQLYAIFLRNCPVTKDRDFNFERWRKRYCFLVLTKDDLNIDQLNERDMQHRKFTFTLVVQTHWNLGAVGRVDFINEHQVITDQNRWRAYVIEEHHHPLKMERKRAQFMKP